MTVPFSPPIDCCRVHPDAEVRGATLQLCYRLYCDKEGPPTVPEQPVYELLCGTLLCTAGKGAEDHYWCELARRLIGQRSDLGSSLLRQYLRQCATPDWQLRSSRGMVNQFMCEIIGRNPSPAWAAVRAELDEASENGRSNVLWWLGEDDGWSGSKPGPIALLPADQVLEWVATDPIVRAPQIARTVPKTFDKHNGALTRGLLTQFGDVGRVQNLLNCHFHSRGWYGNESDHHRRLRDEAQGWLADETEPAIICWLEQYVRDLNRSVQQAEISEEREW